MRRQPAYHYLLYVLVPEVVESKGLARGSRVPLLEMAIRARNALAVRKAQGKLLGNRTNIKIAGELGRASAKTAAAQFAANVMPVAPRFNEAASLLWPASPML